MQSSRPDWQRYEDRIFEQLQAKFPDAKLTKNAHLDGRMSKEKRQIDICAEFEVLGHQSQAIVDCKYYSKKVDVKTVEAFIGMMRDVGAEVGIIFTEIGYSRGAHNRAEFDHVKLDILKLEQLPDYEIPFELCSECEPDGENWSWLSNYISWHDAKHVGDIKGDTGKVSEIGWCNWCSQLYVRCKRCGTGTALVEWLPVVECEGGCGTTFELRYEPIGSGLCDTILVVKRSREKP